MIQSPLLPQFNGFIDGQWTGARTNVRLRVINPATGEALADVPDMGHDRATEAVEAAAGAMEIVTSIAQRREWLQKIEQALLAEREELGRIITLEQGKPLREAIAEADYAAGFFRVCAERIDVLLPQTLRERPRGCAWTVHHRPAGVVATITPWNFPLAMLAKKLSAAIAAGCAVVHKPAELTPLASIAQWTILDRVGLPRGFANLLIGQAEPIGEIVCAHPAVRVVSFTGSMQVGRTLMR
jgi:succinate-semialdehyde dehydrogenase/glutarate-semialdehyde dehydrogenase